eukprot:360182-Chlamydomonas_euryale.AAC.4
MYRTLSLAASLILEGWQGRGGGGTGGVGGRNAALGSIHDCKEVARVQPGRAGWEGGKGEGWQRRS